MADIKLKGDLHMPQYGIADAILEIKTENAYLSGRMSGFTTASNHVDIHIYMEQCNSISLPEGKQILNEDLKWLEKPHGTKGFYGYRTFPETDNVVTLLDSGENWQNASVYYVETGLKDNAGSSLSDILSFHLAGVAFRNALISFDGIVIHASSIECEGRGILFSAPAGTGKSTHAGLWKKYKAGANILNDDSPALRIKGERVYIYGTPWSGSTDRFTNSSAPLAAFIILEQGSENSIRRLSPREAVTRIIPRCFLPYVDNSLMEKAMVNIETMIKLTPAYLLRCLPDKDAVELVYGCIS